MFQYSKEQLATIIGVPIVTLVIIWTVTIFHKNRKNWNSYDIAIVAVLIQSILRNITILCYTTLVIVNENLITTECCRVVVWIFNSVHTFQASSLTTLAVIALFTVSLYRKQQTLQLYLTPTHVIYHLFCLTTLCACVGVASILAQEDAEGIFFSLGPTDYCHFMPFELDIKFNVFIIVLHIFLSMVSFAAFIFICMNHMKMRRQGFEYLKKSSSDLSDLSMCLTASVLSPNDNSKGYYDTYTIQRGQLVNQCEATTQVQNPVNYCHAQEAAWNSDVSNLSTTVSSTNSKKPCLNSKSVRKDGRTMETGLQTMYPILAVCYLFNHLPLIVLCIFPRLALPWTVSGVALWMGQLQDVLIPIGLGLVDSRFCKWVSHVYKCNNRQRVTEKIPPGVGLDGKFRHIGSQPQSLETSHSAPPERSRSYSATEHKFPITNGSLYTSIDGRLPIIHNYRRHKNLSSHKVPPPPHSQNVNLHSSHLQRPRHIPLAYENNRQNMYLPQDNQQLMLHHICRDPSYFRSPSHDVSKQKNVLKKHISLSQDTLDTLDVIDGLLPGKPRLNRQKLLRNRNKRGLANRISKSEDSLNDLQKDLLKFRENPESFEKSNKQDFSMSSDDEYCVYDIHNTGTDYDAASQSSYSITTEANCDFEFYQNKNINQIVCPKVPSLQELNFNIVPNGRKCSFNELNGKAKLQNLKQNSPNLKHGHCLKRSNSRCSKESNPDLLHIGNRLRITRSNSKRSLESFHAYIDEGDSKVQRANSFITMEERKNQALKQIKRRANAERKIMNIPENVGNNNVRNLYNLNQANYHKSNCNARDDVYSSSVPDLKKVFISDYI